MSVKHSYRDNTNIVLIFLSLHRITLREPCANNRFGCAFGMHIHHAPLHRDNCNVVGLAELLRGTRDLLRWVLAEQACALEAEQLTLGVLSLQHAIGDEGQKVAGLKGNRGFLEDCIRGDPERY